MRDDVVWQQISTSYCHPTTRVNKNATPLLRSAVLVNGSVRFIHVNRVDLYLLGINHQDLLKRNNSITSRKRIIFGTIIPLGFVHIDRHRQFNGSVKLVWDTFVTDVSTGIGVGLGVSVGLGISVGQYERWTVLFSDRGNRLRRLMKHWFEIYFSKDLSAQYKKYVHQTLVLVRIGVEYHFGIVLLQNFCALFGITC